VSEAEEAAAAAAAAAQEAADVAFLRRFLPPSAPALASVADVRAWLTEPDRRFAVCLCVHQRSLSLEQAGDNAFAPLVADKRFAARHAAVRIEAMYEVGVDSHE
jgi:hypothetical protein